MRLAAGTFAISLLMCAPVWAQDILGNITGTVKDSSGAVVADATVKARSINTNQEATQHTDANGSYSALNLAIGIYEVTISKDRIPDGESHAGAGQRQPHGHRRRYPAGSYGQHER